VYCFLSKHNSLKFVTGLHAGLCVCVCMQWKFAFLSLGRPEYLQDGDIVASRFQVGGVGFEESLLTNSLFCLPRKIDIETLKTNDLMPLVWSCRRETHMVRGNTIWVWSMQIWPPKGLMLQTRLLSSHIALPFLYSKEGKESLRQFSPIHGTLVRTMFFYVLFCP